LGKTSFGENIIDQFKGLDALNKGESIANLISLVHDFYGSEITDSEDRWFYDGISFGELDYLVVNSKFEGEEQSKHTYNAIVKEKKVSYVPTAGILKTTFEKKEEFVDASYVPFLAKVTKGDATITTPNPAWTTNGDLTFGLTMGKDTSTIKIELDFELGTMPEIGDEIALNPKDNIFTDSRDGHKYKYVKIGSQVWMAENLAYLPIVNLGSSKSHTEPKYYVYSYTGTDVNEAKKTSNYSTYGVLYNWPAAIAACPPGWHLASDSEWTILTQLATFNL
jgi:hypothetical protein